MGTRAATVDHLLDQLAGAGVVTAKKMFGEYGLYLEGRMFALVCDDQLFLKPTAGGLALLGTPKEGFPYPGAKACYLLDEDLIEDMDLLAKLARTTALELPLPKPKTPKKPKAPKE